MSITLPDTYVNILYNSGTSGRVIPNILNFGCTFIKNSKNFTSCGYTRTKDASKFDDEINYEIDLKLPYGLTEITYNDEQIYIDYIQEQTIVATSDNILKFETLTLSGKNIEILKLFLEASRKYQLKTIKNNRVICRILQGSYWFELNASRPRNEDTLFLDFNIQTIFDNIQDFYDSEDDYSANGVPFKLNYLLYGVAGSGKTSIIYTIASKFNMDICFVSITKDLDDNSFIKAIKNIPDNNILVIEDIDSLFIERESKSSLSFSTLLNVLDGVLKKNKLITMLTTNFKDRLDDALFRSGRIDYQIEFGYIKKKQIKKMFNYFFKNQEENLVKLIDDTKHLKMCCSDLHRWCFRFRKSDNVIEHIQELLSSISRKDISNAQMYM